MACSPITAFVQRAYPFGFLQARIDLSENRSPLGTSYTLVTTCEGLYLKLSQSTGNAVHEAVQQILAGLVASVNRAQRLLRPTSLNRLRVLQLLIRPLHIGALQMALNQLLGSARQCALQ